MARQCFKSQVTRMPARLAFADYPPLDKSHSRSTRLPARLFSGTQVYR